MVARGIKAALIQYFDAHPNRRLPVERIAKDTGYSEEQVRVGINNLKSAEPDPYREQLITIVRGRIWMFRAYVEDGLPAPDPQKMFALVADNQNGVLILQDSSGGFYKATKLD